MSRPSHTAYIVTNPRDGSPGKAMWREIGACWPHKNGGGFDLIIYEQLSVSGRIVITERRERNQPESRE